MSKIVMPNGTPAKVKSDIPKFEDLTPAEQEQLGQMADSAGDDTHHVTTAYLVVVDHDGSVAIVPDLTLKFTVDRQPTPEDLLGSAAVVQASVTAQITSASTQQVMLNQARAMAKQQQDNEAVQQMRGMNLLRT